MLACDFCHKEIILEDQEEGGWTIAIMPPHCKGDIFGTYVKEFEVCRECAEMFAEKPPDYLST